MNFKKRYMDVRFSIILIFLISTTAAILNGLSTSSVTDSFDCNEANGVVRCTCPNQHESEIFLIDNQFLRYRADRNQIVIIEHCKTVQIAAHSIKDLNTIRQIKLANIQHLILDGYSFLWEPNFGENFRPGLDVPRPKLLIEKTTVKSIASHSIRGYFKEIIFDGVVIENIDQFAFSNLKQMENLVFQNSVVKTVNPQAFKKFSVTYLTMLGTTWERLPSRAFSDIRINKQLRINRCAFGAIESGAFIVDNLEKFEMTESRVDTLEGEGFRVVTRENRVNDVVFRNNAFNDTKSGAFLGFSKMKGDLSMVPGEFIFENNVLNHGVKNALKINTTSFDPKFKNLVVNETCNCDDIESWWTDEDAWIEEVQCYADAQKTLKVSEFKKYNCMTLRSLTTLFIVLGVVGVVVIIGGTVLVIYFRRVLEKKKQAEYDTKNGKNNMGLIVPDGRTYRETELHVIVERADLLTTDL